MNSYKNYGKLRRYSDDQGLTNFDLLNLAQIIMRHSELPEYEGMPETEILESIMYSLARYLTRTFNVEVRGHAD